MSTPRQRAALIAAEGLAEQINNALVLADKLRTAVKDVREKRGLILKALAQDLPRTGLTDFHRNTHVHNVAAQLDALLRPLAGFELKAGKELSPEAIAHALNQLANAAGIKETRP